MRKILALFDGLRYNPSTARFAINLANLTSADVVAVFLDDWEYHTYKIYDLISEEGVSPRIKLELGTKDEIQRRENSNLLRDEFIKAKIQFVIRHDRNNALQDLLHESVFADFAIIFKEETLSPFEEKAPTHFLKQALQKIQCPVMIVPKSFEPIRNVIWMYDGNPSSVYAIKMFNYLFHGRLVCPIEVISIKAQTDDLYLPDHKYMDEYINRYTDHARITILKGEPKDQVVEYLTKIPQDSLIVLGAYQRSKISRWLKRSMADQLLKKFDFPLFIAHF